MTLEIMGPVVVQSIESVAQMAASAFVSSLWQGVLLAAAVWLCLRFLPKMTAAVRFAVWSAVFVVILLLPLAQIAGAHSGAGVSGSAFQLDVRWSYLILAAWAGLSLARGVKLAVSAWRLRQLWRRSTPVPAILPVMKASSILGPRQVEICTSKEIDRPSVIGFFAPRILIPEWLFEKLTPAELEQIVMHEFGHISRSDDWINLFQKIGLLLFPLNPTLVWIDRRLCFERELACDDGVLEQTQAPASYATALVSLAERSNLHRGNRRTATLSLGAWERQSELGQRVESILSGGKRMSSRRAKVAAGTIGVALLGVAAGLSRVPHFVSFSEGMKPGPIAERPIPMPPSVAIPEFRPTAFHPDAAAHEVLLKATMPAGTTPQLAHTPCHKKATARHTPRAAVKPTPARAIPTVGIQKASAETQRWVVLTTFSATRVDESAGAPSGPASRPAMMLTVDGEHAIAAVRTGDGWLVIQL